MDALLIGNDHLLEVIGLQDQSGAYLNSKTVTAVVKTAANVNVSGQSWPLTLTYVAASDGDYKGTLEDGLVLTEGVSYWIEITADAGGGLIAFWRYERMAQYRTP